MAKESKESCRFGKSLVCPKCKAVSNFDFSTDLILDYLMVDAVCPSCGKEFKATLDSVTNNRSVRQSRKAKQLELRESCRMGKSFVCSSCGSSIDFDLITDSTLKGVNIAGCCPGCYADMFLTLDSFLNNRAVLIYPEEAEPKVQQSKRGDKAQQKKHKQKAEKLDYIR
jgi:hypothetical protein